ncbi:MAG: MFS transporter, partial [Planctomycetaceae bacterium]|nr:MFS transporter [Planctomycetaceae bacterium]
PTLALVNAITFQNVTSIEDEFPKIRLWGTIGWIVSGLVVSESMLGIFPLPLLPGIEDAGSTSFPLKLSAVVSIIYGLYSFTLPASPPQGRGEPISIVKILGLDALQLFKNPSYAVFALCSFLICIPLAFYYARTYEFTSAMAFGDRTSGVMALGQVSEIGFMAAVPFFIKRLGVKKMLLVGMLAWAVRYGLFGMMPSSSAMLVLGIVLHGICYDFFFVTGQIYVDTKADQRIRGAAQGFIAFATLGVGSFIGAELSSVVQQQTATPEGPLALDWQTFWLIPAAGAGVVMILFALLFNESKAVEQEAVEAATTA